MSTYQLNLSSKSPTQAGILNKLTSLQKNRIALDYVKYRSEIEDEQRGGGIKSLEYEFFKQEFIDKAKQKGLHDKLRTINTVNEIKDYTNENTIEIRDMQTNERL